MLVRETPKESLLLAALPDVENRPCADGQSSIKDLVGITANIQNVPVADRDLPIELTDFLPIRVKVEV